MDDNLTVQESKNLPVSDIMTIYADIINDSSQQNGTGYFYTDISHPIFKTLIFS